MSVFVFQKEQRFCTRDGTLYDEVTQNNIGRLQTKTVDAETNARLVQRENKSFTLAEGNIANLPNGTGIVKIIC